MGANLSGRNAHASSTPHHVGQVAKAEILVAHLLDTAPAGTDHQRQAAVIVQQLQNDLGWTAPRDLTEVPPLQGPSSTQQARDKAREQLAATIAANRAARMSVTDGRVAPQDGTVGHVVPLPAGSPRA